jgi:hypothetical protein
MPTQLLLPRRLFVADEPPQVRSRDELHRDEGNAFDLAAIEDRHRVRVVQRCCRTRFAQHASLGVGPLLGRRIGIRTDDLQRHAVQARVVRAKDGPHSPVAQLRLELKAVRHDAADLERQSAP